MSRKLSSFTLPLVTRLFNAVSGIRSVLSSVSGSRERPRTFSSARFRSSGRESSAGAGEHLELCPAPVFGVGGPGDPACSDVPEADDTLLVLVQNEVGWPALAPSDEIPHVPASLEHDRAGRGAEGLPGNRHPVPAMEPRLLGAARDRGLKK
jgi:hypothetical protein